jgi:hypothetical protein
MRNLLSSIFILAFFFLNSAFAQNSLCVLGYERREFPISIGLKKLFSQYENVKLVVEAKPQDLVECLKLGYEEIIFVSHALLMDDSAERVNLGYFQEKIGRERTQFIDGTVDQLKARLTNLETQSDPKSEKKRKKILGILQKIQNFPSDKPIYGEPLVILNRFFESVEKEMDAEVSSHYFRLKKFRLMTCESDKILERYPFFRNLNRFGVELDVAPSSKLGSLLTGKSVTNFSFSWLKKSLEVDSVVN